jgi:branched-subunit amino acid transport protein AzlD
LLFNIIGGTAALLQVAALFYLLKDLKGFKLATLMQLALAAFIIKICLQLLSALPFIALLAYEHRNFVIAYLHLALLGSISFFLFHFCFEAFALRTRSIKVGLSLFLLSFIATEILLVLFSLGSVIGFGIPNYNLLLLLCSILFPGGLLLITLSIRKKLRSQFQLN